MKHVLTPEQASLIAELFDKKQNEQLQKQISLLRRASPDERLEDIIVKAADRTLRVLAARAADFHTSVDFSRQTILPIKDIFRKALQNSLRKLSDETGRRTLLRIRRAIHDVLCREPELQRIAV